MLSTGRSPGLRHGVITPRVRAGILEKLAILAALLRLIYLLTFCCYGTHPPGDARGRVDRARGDRRGGFREPSAPLELYATEHMLHAPYTLNARTADIVLEAIREVCIVRDWQLIAAHVRNTHVHCVVGGVEQPNRAIADFKAYASRALNKTEGYRKRWAREGSTRRLPNATSVDAAVRYVMYGHGEAMAVYASQR